MPPGTVYTFGDFTLAMPARRLQRDDVAVPLSDRQLSVLAHLVARAGTVASKDELIAVAWEDVAVTDNSLEQAISVLRRALGTDPRGRTYVETVPRKGYRFAGEVTVAVARESDDALDQLLAPHRAFLEGRAALESLERDAIVRAREVFERVAAQVPDHAAAHVGLANALVLSHEMTRSSGQPDTAALAQAVQHAQDAVRLDAQYAEAWATLGFVLDRTGARTDALAASRRAAMLAPSAWRHQFRLAYVSWGEERLDATRRLLALMPGFPQAHWFAASVHVARQAFGEAERELEAGVAALEGQLTGPARLTGVGLHWVLGLLALATGDAERALAAFRRELALEADGHLYARECCANTWYAIGAMRLRQRHDAQAVDAFRETLARVPNHPLAHAGLAMLDDRPAGPEAMAGATTHPADTPLPMEAVFAAAAHDVRHRAHAAAAERVGQALAAAPPASAGWLLPIDPLLDVTAHPDAWAGVLRLLRARAA
jgi:DNA-binding winged helix-turn-helix (wHTH) protein/cytochrome c-type biogenesis protein CcmH/NrfG